MIRRSRVRWGLLAALLVGIAFTVRLSLPTPVLPESQAAASRSTDRSFYEEQTARRELLERLMLFAAAPEHRGDVEVELSGVFKRWEESYLRETQLGSLRIVDAEHMDAIAVSASGNTVAVTQGERCFLFGVNEVVESPNELRVTPSADPAVLELPGRAGDPLLLDHDGQHVIYLAADGVVHSAEVHTGRSAAIDAAQLTGVTLLAGGLKQGWMLGGNPQGAIYLFNLAGTVLKCPEVSYQEGMTPPELLSLACDADGEIVLAGYSNSWLQWFRRDGDQLIFDGDKRGLPSHIQSVSTDGIQFAAAGKNFYYTACIPEPGKKIDVDESFTRTTMHERVQIALSPENAAGCLSVWGETSEILSDRSAVWLYSVALEQGHLDRPFGTSIPSSTQLRRLSASGSLLAVVDGDTLHVARPPGRDVPPPARFTPLVKQLLDEERYEELEMCARYLGHRSRPLHHLQSNWIESIGRALLPENGDFRVREKRLLEWIDKHPDSIAAWLALAAHYTDVAWDARGSGLAGTVSDFGWEMVERDIPKADAIIRAMLATSCREPALMSRAASLSGIASWTASERRELAKRAIALYPRYVQLHETIAFFELPRWGGTHAEVISHLEQVANAIGEERGDAYYAALVIDALQHFPPELGPDSFPIDLDRMHRGMQLTRPDEHWLTLAVYRLMRRETDRGLPLPAAFYLDQMSRDHPLMPHEIELRRFREIAHWVKTGYASVMPAIQQPQQVPQQVEQEAAADSAVAPGDGEGGESAPLGEAASLTLHRTVA